MHGPSAGLANQPHLNPATHQEAACREYFIDLDKKIQYLLNRSSDFRSICIRLLEKMCLTKRDP